MLGVNGTECAPWLWKVCVRAHVLTAAALMKTNGTSAAPSGHWKLPVSISSTASKYITQQGHTPDWFAYEEINILDQSSGVALYITPDRIYVFNLHLTCIWTDFKVNWILLCDVFAAANEISAYVELLQACCKPGVSSWSCLNEWCLSVHLSIYLRIIWLLVKLNRAPSLNRATCVPLD